MLYGFYYFSEWLYVLLTNDKTTAENVGLIAVGIMAVLIVSFALVIGIRIEKRKNKEMDKSDEHC